jgi:hypothetical protein
VEPLGSFYNLGDRRGIAEVLEGLAGLAALEGRPVEAGRMFGVAEVLREQTGAPLPSEESRYAVMINTARDQVEPSAWSEACSVGRATALEDVLVPILEHGGWRQTAGG